MADYNFLANPTLVDPVGAINKGLTAANAFHENQLYQAKKQAGEAFQSSINPDGSPNQAAFLQNIKRNPAIAPFAQNAAQGGETLDNAAHGTLIRRLTEVSGSLMGLAGAHPNGIPKDVLIKEIDRVASLYGLPPASAEKLRGAVTDDPRTNLGLVFKTATGLMDAGSAAAATVGTAPMVNTGQTTEQVPQPGPMSLPVGGNRTVVDQGMTAAQLAEPVEVIDQNPNSPTYKKTILIPRGEAMRQAGIPIPQGGLRGGGAGAPLPPVGGGVGRGGGPGAQPPGAIPRLPGATPPQTGATGAPAVQTPAPASQAGVMGVTRDAPGETSTLEASAGAWSKAQQDMGTYTNRIFPLAQAIALEPGVTTGPMSERINAVKAFLVSRAADLGVNPETISSLKNTTADFEKLNKYLVQYTSSLPMAAGTDARLAQAVTGNPSVILSNLGLKEIAQAALALERFNYAAALDFQERGLQANEWAKHLSTFQRTHDPRAFLADIADPAKLRRAVQSMTSSERTAFMRTHQWVANHPDVMNKPTMPGR